MFVKYLTYGVSSQWTRLTNRKTADMFMKYLINAYTYYLQPDLLSCSTTPEEYILLQDLSHKDSNYFWEEVYRQGYEYIIYEYNFSQRHLVLGMTPSIENTPTWMTLETIFSSSTQTDFVYRIITDTHPPFEQKSCEQTPSGSWVIYD